MRSRRDQVQAYFFIVGRLVSALLLGRPDPQERPNRRLSVGIFIGAILSVIILAGFAIYGLFRPGGSDSWRTPGSIIQVKETGARYILLDGQLRPVLNYTSARLVLQAAPPIRSVAGKSLTGMPVGAPIGIPGAPDALPTVDRLYQGAWTVCARLPAAPGEASHTALILGGDVGTVLPAAAGLVVSTPDNVSYLVWQGRRYRLATPAVAMALGYGGVKPLPVTPAWINPIPTGRDLTFPAVAGLGSPGRQIAGRPGTVGQVYEVRNAAMESSELYLLRRDGLVRLSRTAAALILADPAVKQAYPGTAVSTVRIGPDDLGGVPISPEADFVTGYPASPPPTVNDIQDALPCVRQKLDAAGATVTITVVPADVVRRAMPVTGPLVPGSAADEIVMDVGTGMVVVNRPAPGAAPGALYLVSEFGVKFPIADAEAVKALGYGGVSAVEVSSELLALLPTGPVLSSTAALTSQAVGR